MAQVFVLHVHMKYPTDKLVTCLHGQEFLFYLSLHTHLHSVVVFLLFYTL